MKALILYRSHYGNTKEIAEEMAKELHARGVDSIVADLRRRLPNLDEFDAASRRRPDADGPRHAESASGAEASA